MWSKSDSCCVAGWAALCFRELKTENAINIDSILFLLKIIERNLGMAKAEQRIEE